MDGRLQAAVLVADVEGYSRLMAVDETATFRALQQAVSRAGALAEQFHGQLVCACGDSFRALFPTSPAALEFARRFQRDGPETEPISLRFRIGIHRGQVELYQGKVYGTAVQVAERLQEHAPAGDVCLSEVVRQACGLTTHRDLMPLGRIEIHPRGESVAAFVLPLAATRAPRIASAFDRPPTATDTVSVVVLPFVDMAGDLAMAHPADSLGSELAGHLCRFRELRVVSLPPVASGAGRRIERAHADFLVTGTLVATGSKARLCVSLYQAASGRLLWSDRRTIDPARLADAMTSECELIAARLIPPLRRAMAAGGPTPDQELSAPYLIARGFALCDTYRRDGVELASTLFRKALGRTPDASRALAGLARTCSLAWLFGWSAAPERILDRAGWLAQQSVARDPADAGSWAELGWVRLHRQEDDAARAAFERALELNPNDPDILARYAAMLHRDGQPLAALATIRKAMRLNPLQPDFYLWALAAIHDEAERFKAAASAIRRMRDPELGRRLLALSYAQLGLLEQARAQSRHVLRLAPETMSVDPPSPAAAGESGLSDIVAA